MKAAGITALPDSDDKIAQVYEAVKSLDLRAGGECCLYSDIDEVLWHDNPVSEAARRQLLHRLKGKLSGLEIEVVKKVG